LRRISRKATALSALFFYLLLLYNQIKPIIITIMFFKRMKYLCLAAIILLPTASAIATDSSKPIVITFLGVDIKERATRAIQFLLSVAGTVALLMLIVGGIFFMISIGNPDSQQKAKRMVIGALAGLIVILMSFALISLVNDFLV